MRLIVLPTSPLVHVEFVICWLRQLKRVCRVFFESQCYKVSVVYSTKISVAQGGETLMQKHACNPA